MTSSINYSSMTSFEQAVLSPHVLWPTWQAPKGVNAFVTTRSGGVSTGPYASMNTRMVVGESEAAVAENRVRITQLAGAAPLMLHQVHGTEVFDADEWRGKDGSHATKTVAQADAIICSTPGVPIEIQTADCLPVLFAHASGELIGAAHAGWRGLAAGVLENTVGAMLDKVQELGLDHAPIMAYLGPGIGPTAFQVGADVLQAFTAWDAQAARHFVQQDETHWLCDLPALAVDRLRALGVTDITLSGRCTYTEADTFFSYRREKVSGRMASVMWLSVELN